MIKNNRIIKFLKYALWNVSIAIVLLFVSEFLIRLILGPSINYQSTSGNLYKANAIDHTYGWKPHAHGLSFGTEVRINNLGLRGADVDLNEVQKILLLIGDSVLFGVGVPDSQIVSFYLQKQLSPRGWTVLNTGVIGYSAKDYLAVAQHWLQEKKVKTVFVFWVLNDVYQQSPHLEKFREIAGLDKTLWFLRTHSKLYLWAKHVLLNRSQAYFLYDYQFYRKHTSQLKESVEMLRKLDALCQQQGVNLAVVLLPYRNQLKKEIDSPFLPQKVLTDSLKKYQISVIDSRYAFLGRGNPDLFYLYGDPMHLSARGHFRLALFLMKRMQIEDEKIKIR